MTEKCPKSMRKTIYRNLLKGESNDPCGRRETFKAQSHLSRLRAIFQGSELVRQGPEGFQRSRSQSWLVFFVLLVNSLGNTNREKMDVLPDVSAAYCIKIYNDCYVSTYGIPYIFKKNTFLILQMTLYASKGQLIQSLPFFCRSDQF